MVRVSSSTFLKDYGSLSDRALLEPVTITRNGRDRLVLLSAEAFEELHNATRRARAIESLDADEIEAIRAARVPPEFADPDEDRDADHS